MAMRRRKDPLNTGILIPLLVALLGGVAILLAKPTRDLDHAIEFVDVLVALAFFPAGLVIGRRGAHSPWRLLGGILLVVSVLRLLVLLILRLAFPLLLLVLFDRSFLVFWLLLAVLCGISGVFIGLREGFSTVFLHEVRRFFRSPATWIFLASGALLSGASFVAHLSEALVAQDTTSVSLGAAIFVPTIKEQASLLLFVVPVLALRYASAQSSLYGGLPLSTFSLTFGRFCASLLLCFFACIVVILLPLILGPTTRISLWGSLVALGGLLLLSSAACALALLFAEVGRSALGAGGLGLFFALAAGLAQGHADTSPHAWVRTLFRTLSMAEPFAPFSEGILDLRSIIFFLSVSGAGLFFSIRFREMRRWR